jgi:8-oxo-dGTP diphosphatase
MTSPINKFNIRVYGILTNEQQEVLLVKEKIGNFEFVKFPGGGLNFGEGITECLIREFKEETAQDISIVKHIYTTDFFVKSAFKETDQLISLYYEVACPNYRKIPKERTIHLDGARPEHLQFIWTPLANLTPEILTFPIDKHLVTHFLNN